MLYEASTEATPMTAGARFFERSRGSNRPSTSAAFSIAAWAPWVVCPAVRTSSAGLPALRRKWSDVQRSVFEIVMSTPFGAG